MVSPLYLSWCCIRKRLKIYQHEFEMVMMQKWSVVFALASLLSLRCRCVCLCVAGWFHGCIISNSISMPNISAAAPQYSQEEPC